MRREFEAELKSVVPYTCCLHKYSKEHYSIFRLYLQSPLRKHRVKGRPFVIVSDVWGACRGFYSSYKGVRILYLILTLVAFFLGSYLTLTATFLWDLTVCCT